MFHNQSFGIKSEQILLDSNLSMLNEDTIRDYRNYFKLYSPRPNLIGNDIVDFCKRIGIADNEGHLNYGGLMCFGKEEWVRRYVPTFWMDLVEIPGRSVREARTRYTYRIPEQENLWEYFQIMIRRLRLIVDTPFMMNDEGFNVEDRSQFKILREALVNMLSHFDPFSTIHSCIHIYTDRVEFFNLLSADDVTETVELDEIEGSIAAGTPVIIKMKDGATELKFSEVNKEIANEVKTAETANGNYQLQGLYTQKMFSKDTDNNCYIVKGDKLMNPAKLLGTSTEFVGSKPFRAYMVDNSSAPAAGARMFSISVGGSTTAIEQLESTADSKAEYYDLQGRRLQNLQKGVNIVKRGGKTMKVIIK